MNYKSNKILNIKGQSLTADIRTKGSMSKIYAVKCWPTTADASVMLMQIPRGYKGYQIIPSDRYTEGYFISHHTVGSFRSLVRRGWQWYIDLPYYCYAYEHTYKAVPARLNLKLHIIKLRGDIRDAYRIAKDKISFTYSRIKWSLSPLRYYKEWKARKEDAKFWASFGE